MKHGRGAVLLEVVAALTIFSFAAMAAVELVNQLMDGQRRAAEEAARLADQDRLLTALTFLTAGELDQRLGTRAAGPWVVSVQRPESLLYRLSIGDSAGPRLTTLVYRREPS